MSDWYQLSYRYIAGGREQIGVQAYSRDGLKLGQWILDHQHPRTSPELTWGRDLNGNPFTEVTLIPSGRTITYTIEPAPKGLIIE